MQAASGPAHTAPIESSQPDYYEVLNLANARGATHAQLKKA